MKTILSIILIIALVSCSKTENEIQQDQQKVFVRVQAIDIDGNVDFTNTEVVNIKK